MCPQLHCPPFSFFSLIYFGSTQPLLLCVGFLDLQWMVPTLRCSAWASHCSDFSCCREQARGPAGFSSCGTWAQLLLQHVEFSPTRNQTHVPCVGSQILYHWTTREVRTSYLLCPLPRNKPTVSEVSPLYSSLSGFFVLLLGVVTQTANVHYLMNCF